ncbi:uncharacterized protein [Watersipora subatra]|uniref:uncharacterized protein n=1 Tax=Watersipora subatra TaxID=2589382 RepID=UPI00355C04D7
MCSVCCGTNVRLVETDRVLGMSSLFEVVCNDCKTVVMSQHTSQSVVNGRAYDINDRFVYSCKSNGVDYEQACSFISDLNLSLPIHRTSYFAKLGKLATACSTALEEHFRIIRNIVKEEYIKLEELSADTDKVDIAVSYDGTWQKRGYSSHNGVFVAIDILTGYVVDFQVMSNLCQVCDKGPRKDDSGYDEFWEKHREVCKKNHDGSSGAMEMEAAKIIWQRSVAGPLRYTTMLSDGDSAAYDAVAKLKVYGDASVRKEECVNHVAKRVTTYLNKLKDELKNSKTKISGKDLLTAELIKSLQSYYRNAIKLNKGKIDAMEKAILATPYHITSDESHPQHDYCPDNSWCWYKNPSMTPSRPALPNAMLNVILPVYKRLSDRKLLERCKRVATQNTNECFNGEIWRRCPKTQWCGKRAVTIGATMAAMVFNSGRTELFRIQKAFGLSVGEKVLKHAQAKDEHRLTKKCIGKNKRKATAHRKMIKVQKQRRKEGVTYAAGGFSA